jgi:2-deoxy-D-gluconate 3-dehydrogenase
MIAEFFEAILKKYGKLDILINNVQTKPEGFYAPFEEYKKETLTKVLDANLGGAVISSQYACKIFLKQGYGNIINISSTYGNIGADQRLYDGVKNIYFPDSPFSSPVSYAITKAGMINLTRYLASYYREKNIRVNCLTPGGVFDNHDDNFVKNYSYRTILGRMADKNEYNGAILYLASEASSYMTGSNLIVDGGWTAI